MTTLAGGTMTTECRSQVTDVTWSMQAQEFRIVTTFNNTIAGTITVTDTEITMADLDNRAMTLETTAFIAGEEFAI